MNGMENKMNGFEAKVFMQAAGQQFRLRNAHIGLPQDRYNKSYIKSIWSGIDLNKKKKPTTP